MARNSQTLAQRFRHGLPAQKPCPDRKFYPANSSGAGVGSGLAAAADVCLLLKSLAESDSSKEVRTAALEELARRWHREPDIYPLVKTKAESDASSSVRRAAVQAMASASPLNPETLTFLTNIAVGDRDAELREIALQEIAGRSA